MLVCTFFGHRECPESVKSKLLDAIMDLIKRGADTFYVGNNGKYDAYVRSVLRQIQVEYPHIQYAVVLAYLPTEKSEYEDYSDTMYPEGIEEGLKKFAIERRNNWLVNQANYVICYIGHSWGGAYKFARLAKRRGKVVINL